MLLIAKQIKISFFQTVMRYKMTILKIRFNEVTKFAVTPKAMTIIRRNDKIRDVSQKYDDYISELIQKAEIVKNQ